MAKVVIINENRTESSWILIVEPWIGAILFKIDESTWKSQELSSKSKYAYILSYYIINRDVYKDSIYDVTTENKVIDLQNESWFLKNYFFKWTHRCKTQ